MNPHEVERTIAGIACGFFFILGGLICSFVYWKADSVKVNQTCYCEVSKMTTTTTAWIVTNDAGQFLNSYNGKYDSQLSMTSHVYFNFDRANRVAKYYNAKVKEITVTVEAK